LLLLAKQQQQKIVNLYTISVCYAWALSKPEKQKFFENHEGENYIFHAEREEQEL
jgi:hypothetical protein